MDILEEITSRSAQARIALQDEIQRALSGPNNDDGDEPPGFGGSGILFGNQPPAMRSDEYLKASLGWVYGCVARISDAVASVPLRLYDYKDEETEEIMEHPAIDLLDRVNNYTTRIDHFWLTQNYLELAGEAPWFISRGKDGVGEPDNILLLRPDRLTIKQNKEPKAETPIAGFVFKTDDGKDVDIKPSELIFLKYPDTVNYFRGKGTLAAAAKTVDIDNFSEDYNKRFFYNSARPDSILATEQKLTIEQRQVLQQQVKKLYQGKDKAHKTAILESGLKWSPMSLSPKDMDFLEQQKFDMAKIFSIFGVPKAIMAISDDVNLANAKMGEYLFAKYTIKPKMKRIVAQLNEFYLPMFEGTETMFFSFDDPVPEDVDARVKKYDSALGHGWMTQNEIRDEENLSPIDGGDDLLVPNNYVPIGMAGQLSSPVDNAPTRSPGRIYRKDLPGIIERSAGGYQHAVIMSKKQEKNEEKKSKSIEKVKLIEQKIQDISMSMVRGMIRQKKQRAANREREHKARVDSFVDVYVKSIASFERVFKAGMLVIFKNQLQKLLNKIPQKAIKIELDDWQIDGQEETQVMVRVFTPVMGRIIKEQGDKAAMLAGAAAQGAFNMATAAVQQYLQDRSFKFSFEVNEETNRLLADTLKAGVAEGESIPQLRNRVQEVFTDMEKYRAERIARSEVVRASNFAASEAYEQSGVVEGMQWLVTPDDRLCEFCAPMDGKTISLGETFFDKGDTAHGSDGGKFDLDYEDVEFPPLHSNCRCTVVPIVK